MKPAAGAIPANPAIAPFITAEMVGFPVLAQLRKTHTNAQVEAPIGVTRRAFAAKAPEANARPALKPNPPNHKREPPIAANGRLWGTIIWGPKFLRLPNTKAAARDAIPALVCITIPPAKSKTPS